VIETKYKKTGEKNRMLRAREKAKSCLLFVIQPGFKMKKKKIKKNAVK